MTEQLLGVAGTIISMLIGIIQVAFFLWVRGINSALTELRKSHSEYKLHVAENYVTNVILSDHLDRFEKSLDEIKFMIRGQH